LSKDLFDAEYPSLTAGPMSIRSFVLAALVSSVVTANAQTSLPQRQSTAGVKTMKAYRTAASMTIDGKLDEAAWNVALPVGDFTQSYPNVGAAPTERTEVRVLYDDDALYVGVRMFDSHPDSIAAQLARRDASGIYSDWLHLVIDSYHDRRSGFRFSVNPKGVQKDVLHSDDRNEDANWDAVWEAATVVDSAGWTVEYRIPFSQLRFGNSPKGVERLWGIQIQRDIARRSERDSWSPWKSADPGYISFMGDLTGIVDIPTPQRLEVMPYVSAKLARSPGDLSNPFYKTNDFKPSLGADLKYGLPGGLTLTATANPDFGQVEVDPAVVNLSAYESFFPEKRPFFVEGANIFNLGRLRGGPSFGSQQIFYSRRIGRPPQRSPGGAFADSPEASTILGAAKVTGKAGAWTVGILDAVTAEEKARIDDGNGVRTTTPVEPATNYFVSRIRREFNAGNTVISGGGTSVFRDLSDPLFKDLLRSSANVGAIDFEHQWHNHIWALTGAAAVSSIAGSKAVITNAQRSSARYYQRPDADYLTLDPDKTRLDGNSLALGLNKGGSWQISATAKQVSPGYEVNDLGFMGRVDYRNVGISTSYLNTTPGKIFRDFNYGIGTNHAFNYGGDRIWTSVFNFASVTLKNLWYMGGGSEYDPGAYDDRLTRGGPVGKQPTQYGGYFYGGTDARKPVSYYWNFSYYGDEDGGYYKQINPEIDLRPSTSVTVSFTPNVSYTLNTIQYVQSVADALADATFDRRYVLANLRQTTVSASTRVAWTVSPALSFQFYAQPFAAVGHYDNFKELAKPRTREYLVYGRTGTSTIAPTTSSSGDKTGYAVDPDGSGPAPSFSIGNPDFRIHSLRGNAVVRWEYRPGSALFFVWQQQRSGFQPFDGTFRTGRDLRDIFGQPSNVFLVKATYWFAR
jgi:hypothetical protein